MKSVSTVVTASIVVVTFIFINTLWQYRRGGFDGFTGLYSSTTTTNDDFQLGWPKIIWQTSKYPSERQTEAERTLAQTWADKNPTYRHHIMTHERMLGYLSDNFQEGTAESDLYHKTTDYMMRTDVLRYLVLLKDGGVYNDLDVECLKPIDSWIPAEFKEKAGVVIGIEIDNDLGPSMNQPGSPYLFEFVPWTIIAKPNQPYIRHVVQRLQENIEKLGSEAQAKISQHDLLATTGPAAATVAFMDYASQITGSNVTYRNFTKMTTPMMMGEVLILPIWAFGAGHQVLNSGFAEDGGTVMVKHHFADSWRKDHSP